MIPLLELALDAHGGLTRWRQVKSIDLKLSIGGQLWHAKGLPQGLNVALHVEPSRKLVVVSPFDGEDSTGYFTPDRVWVENAAGTVVQELTSPRGSFSGHDLMTPWSKLQELYFVGYAFLNYLSSPFNLAEPGFEVAEIEPHKENGETWRRMVVRFPDEYPSHSAEQTLYFNQQGLLKRLNYVVDIVGGGPAAGGAHYCFDHHKVGGIIFPTYRRVLGRDPKAEDPESSAPVGVEVRISNIEINRSKGEEL